jgi:CRP/FNR family transcriptional regulator, anaerobic regulatory protein
MNNISPCASCPQSKTGFCGAILGSDVDNSSTRDWQHHFVVGPNKQIIASNQSSPDIHVLCNGWALRFIQLPDGRRQILNFLLPGDLFSASSLFRDRVHFSVKALTAIQVSGMNRNEVQSRITKNPSIAAPAVGISCSAETEASEKMLAAIGLCSAEERIAYLFSTPHEARRRAERHPGQPLSVATTPTGHCRSSWPNARSREPYPWRLPRKGDCRSVQRVARGVQYA